MSTKTTKKAELAVMVAETSVGDAIQVLNDKIASLKHITESVYCTSGKVVMSSGSTLDIKTETNKENLIKAYASIKARVSDIEGAYEDLGIVKYPLVKIDGGSIAEWKKDITLRLAVIDHKDEVDNLTSMKKEWEELMDKEDRKALLLKKMMAKGIA